MYYIPTMNGIQSFTMYEYLGGAQPPGTQSILYFLCALYTSWNGDVCYHNILLTSFCCSVISTLYCWTWFENSTQWTTHAKLSNINLIQFFTRYLYNRFRILLVTYTWLQQYFNNNNNLLLQHFIYWEN